jgi:hypothetical protein
VLYCEGFFRDGGVSQTICWGLASNRDPPDVCLLSSWDYRREPPRPALHGLSFTARNAPATAFYVEVRPSAAHAGKQPGLSWGCASVSPLCEEEWKDPARLAHGRPSATPSFHPRPASSHKWPFYSQASDVYFGRGKEENSSARFTCFQKLRFQWKKSLGFFFWFFGVFLQS